MCVVVPHILARGPAARPRCIPPTCGALGIEPRCATNRIAGCTTRRTWRRASPPTPDHAETTGRFIATQRSLRAPLENPIDIKGVSPPLTTPTRRAWRPPSPSAPNHGGTSAVPTRSGRPPSSRDPMANPARIGCRHRGCRWTPRTGSFGCPFHPQRLGRFANLLALQAPHRAVPPSWYMPFPAAPKRVCGPLDCESIPKKTLDGSSQRSTMPACALNN